MFGKKKSKRAILPANESLILKNMGNKTSASYPITDYEKQFFLAFEESLRFNGIEPAAIHAIRMGNGSIRCSVYAGIIGTVHLRKQFGSLQYFIEPLKNHDMKDAPVEAIIATIPYWVAYLQGLLRLHKAVLTP